MTLKNISENDQELLDFQRYQPENELDTRIKHSLKIATTATHSSVGTKCNKSPASLDAAVRAIYEVAYRSIATSQTCKNPYQFSNTSETNQQPQTSEQFSKAISYQGKGTTLLISLQNDVEEKVLDKECCDFHMHPGGKSYFELKAGTNALSAIGTWIYGQDAGNYSNFIHLSLLPTVAQIPVNHILSWQKT